MLIQCGIAKKRPWGLAPSISNMVYIYEKPMRSYKLILAVNNKKNNIFGTMPKKVMIKKRVVSVSSLIF